MFKKVILLSGLFFLILNTSKAQFALKATPYVVLKNQLVNVSAEFTLPAVPNYAFSIGLASNWGIKNNLVESYSNLKMDSTKSFAGFAIEPGIRRYFRPKYSKFDGLYTGIYSSFRYGHSYYNEISQTSISEGNIIQNTYVSVIGFEIGYQFLLGKKKNLVIDLFTGFGGKYVFDNRVATHLVMNTSFNNTFQNSFATRGNISIGYIIR